MRREICPPYSRRRSTLQVFIKDYTARNRSGVSQLALMREHLNRKDKNPVEALNYFIVLCVGTSSNVISLPLPRPRPLSTAALPNTPPHTTRMHHTPIRPHSNRTPAKPLMTHCAVSILIDYDSSVQSAWLPRLLFILISQAQCQLDADFLNAT